MAKQGAAALAIAHWLRDQREVAEVLCPALPGARGHALFARDFSGTCGLISLVMRPADDDAVHAFLDALSLFGLGYSWGGYESLALSCDPQLGVRTITGAALPKVDRQASLLRAGKKHYLVYPNYDVLLGYNCAHAYALAVGLLSDRIGGS